MSPHHQSLRRQAILKALGVLGDDAEARLAPPAPEPVEGADDVPEPCAEELMFLYGSGCDPFHSISTGETAGALG